MRTAQQLFDHISQHLLMQKKRAVRNIGGRDEACVYLSADGLKCAIGSVIPDDEYKEEIERYGTIETLIISGWLSQDRKEEFMANKHLLYALQGCHDGYEIAGWEKRLKQIAEYHGLQFNGATK